ncbi:MAG TPA: MFS transporter [Bryobacteraceae bacterium]|nr:MFS transporter [Bryobacteraceae bacterium]
MNSAALRHVNWILALLVLSLCINYIDRGVLSVSAPLISKDLSLSPTQMGWLFSTFFWSYAAFQIVSGWLVDRFAVKWVYAGGFLIWSLSTAAVGLIYSFPVLLVARFVLGVGESVAYPACSRILVENFPESRRGFANALVDAGTKVGPGLSTLVGGLLINMYGWRAVFLILGFGSLVWLLPWAAWMTVPSETSVENNRKGPGMSEILRRRQTWGTCLGMFSLGYVWYFLLSWLPSYLVNDRGFSLSAMAVLGSIPFWAMAASSLCGGFLSDFLITRGGNPSKVRKSFAGCGLLLCGAAIAPVAFVADARLSVALLTAACVALGMFSSNVWAITQTLAGPLAAGKWTGIQNAIGNLGGVVSPLLTGWIVSLTGSFLLAFLAATAVLLLGTIAYLSLIGEIRPLVWLQETSAQEAVA